MNDSLYDRDLYAWANEQAALLRAGQLGQADIANIAEEIESMGRSETRELVNQLAVLLTHLLKWQYQPAVRGNSWRLTIRGQRVRLSRHLAHNPSLKSKIDEAVLQAWEIALIETQRETGLEEKSFPTFCPYPVAQAMNHDFWPE